MYGGLKKRDGSDRASFPPELRSALGTKVSPLHSFTPQFTFERTRYKLATVIKPHGIATPS